MSGILFAHNDLSIIYRDDNCSLKIIQTECVGCVECGGVDIIAFEARMSSNTSNSADGDGQNAG